jgi:hypothetical protein
MELQRCENYNNNSTYSDNEQHNGEAGMRGHDLYRQRLQHHTVGWELEGL